MKIIIGLGNPDKKYKQTRHNVGSMTVDSLAEQLGLIWQENKKLKSIIAKNNGMILAKPQTYMNNSGQAVRAILDYYKIIPKKLGLFTTKDSDLSNQLTIIHDDMDIELGKHKLSIDSTSAGHNGVKSIIDYLKTKNFKRIRIGIKNEKSLNIPTEKFVLQNFNKEELEIINHRIAQISTELL